MKEARFIRPADVLPIWNEVEPLITKALVKSDEAYSSLDYLDLIMRGVCALCVGFENNEIKMALVCEATQLPRSKILQIHLWSTKSGYDYDPWMGLFDLIEDYGRENGCSIIEVTVRKGLAKKLNWKHTYSVLTKRI
tara:strand:+ start:42 stop:452 length:411 start_codon:yes stop_codon:yes gene_type:complete